MKAFIGASESPLPVEVELLAKDTMPGFYLVKYGLKVLQLHHSKLIPTEVELQSMKDLAQNKLPYRFREVAFRRYEPILKLVLERFPAPFSLKPEGSIETFTCRFRDAMKSLLKYQWPTNLPMAKFVQCVDAIVVSIQGDLVVIGNSETIKPTTILGQPWTPASTEPTALPLGVTTPLWNVIEAICLLHDHRLLKTSSFLHKCEFSLTALKQLENQYDVFIEQIADREFKIL